MNIKGLKTLAVSAALALVGVLQTADWVDLIGPDNVGPVVIAIAAIMAALRAVTTTPVGKSEPTP